MTSLLALYDRITVGLDAIAPAVLPSVARLVFAATLFTYYLNAGFAKLGDGFLGLFAPGAGAYVTIFPRQFEAVGYDVSQFGFIHWVVAFAGTWGEIILPLLIVAGLFTRIAAAGMIVVVLVQSWVDIVGHGLAEADIGSWFDNLPTAVVLDQRAFWVVLLLILVFRGAGPLSVDRLISGMGRAQPINADRTASLQPR